MNFFQQRQRIEIALRIEINARQIPILFGAAIARGLLLVGGRIVDVTEGDELFEQRLRIARFHFDRTGMHAAFARLVFPRFDRFDSRRFFERFDQQTSIHIAT